MFRLSKGSSESRRLLVLIGIMLAVVLAVVGVALEAMYRLALEQKKHALLDVAKSHAALLAVAVSGGAPTDDPVVQTVERLELFDGLGSSGEVVLARPNARGVDRLLVRRSPEGERITERSVVPTGKLGAPMREALEGRTGIMIARDYRNREVMAAHTYLETLGYGFVAKIDLDEVRAPLLQTAGFALVVALVLVQIAAVLFVRISSPMLRRLEESEARLRDIVAGAGEAIITVDERGAISAANPAAARIFGYREEQLTGRPLRLLFTDATTDGRAMIEPWLQGDMARARHQQLIGVRADGTRFPLELVLSVVAAPHRAFYTGIVHDLTERHAAEQLLLASNEELERRVAERTRALARSNRLLRASSAVQSAFIGNDAALGYERMLHHLIELSESEGGFIARVGGAERATTPAALVRGRSDWTDERIGALRAAAEAASPAWGCAEDPHWPQPCLALTLTHGATPVGVVGMWGRPEYDGALLDYLEPFFLACAQVLREARREEEQEQERQQRDAARRQLSATLLNVQDIIFRTDSAGRVLWISPSVEAACGYRPEEITGRAATGFLAEPAAFGGLQQALERNGGAIQGYEAELLRRDGSRFWGSANCHYFLDAHGERGGIEGAIRDVSAYKQAEQRIATLNRLYTVLSEVNKAIVRERDRYALYETICRIIVEQGRFRMAWIGETNEQEGYIAPVTSAGHVAGYLDGFRIVLHHPKQGSGPTASAIKAGRHVIVDDVAGDPRMGPWRAAALERGYGSTGSFPFRDGARVAGTINVYAPDAGFFVDENVQLLLSLAADVSFATERLNVERRNREVTEELRRAGEKLTHHMQHTPLAVIEYDRDFVVQQWNPAAERMFGYAAREAVGRSGEFIIPPPARPDAAAMFAKFMEQLGGWENINRHVTADGRTILCEWYNTPLTEADGTVTGVMAIGHDITEVVRARDEILALNASLEQRVEERTRELASVNRELESFSYSVSHDLRAPLRAIDGFSDLLLRRYGDALDDGARGYLERVRGAGQRMSHLIDDLLQLSRVARSDLQRERVDLSALAAEVVEELRQGQPERAVEVAIAPQLLAEADGRLLRVVLNNLLGNAWKFTGQTAAPRIEVGAERQGNEHIYFVRDNGAGFDMNYADKLFSAFQRLHGADEFEGTGIGLATVQRVVHRHGGRIWAQAAVNAGATFYFTLGAAEAARESDGTDQDPSVRAAG